MSFYSHLKPSGDARRLQEHLISVGNAAAERATAFNAQDWARTAVFWHDLGKYQARWQKYLAEQVAQDTHQSELMPATHDRPNHALAGAQYAEQHLKDKGGRLLAYVIAGHHAGLPDWSEADGGNGSLHARLDAPLHDASRDELARALESVANSNNHIPEGILFVPYLKLDVERMAFGKPGHELALSLWLRMLFSCLVDADFLDAETFLNPIQFAKRPRSLAAAELLPVFDAYMALKTNGATASKVNTARTQVLTACRTAAQENSGVFSLTVPTGGGKTLASLAFALEHARAHGKRRIIYAIPYTSIIEQTADEFRRIFSTTPDVVIEHHSNLDPDKETQTSKLAAENWDAPLIITTNVQLFESLFAAKTSRCRKLHNIANSVLVLDEAQLLPLGYLKPVVQTLKLLAEHYGVTVLLCTATQPNLAAQQNAFGHRWFEGIGSAREIIAEPPKLYAELERVQVHLPKRDDPVLNWPSLAERMCEHPAALAIVNTRGDAKELCKAIGKVRGAVHLSARMCAEHRATVIGRIKQHLNDLSEGRTQEPLRVVSTTLIEAGVDLDFPVVFRSMAGLDSIAQAAGRCNREGRMGTLGQVHVFTPEVERGRGTMKDARSITRGLLDAGRIANALAPESFALYSGQLLESVSRNANGRGLDEKGLLDLLKPKGGKECSIAFRSAAEACRLIEDGGQSIIVRWGANDEQRAKVEQALSALSKDATQKWAYRTLQRYSVSVPQREFEQMERDNKLEVIGGLFVLREGWYDQDTGLRETDEGMTAASSVI